MGTLLPWLVAGAAVVALLVVLLLPQREDSPESRQAVAAPDVPTDVAPGPLTGTPREQADRLFNRIMQEREAGDSARAAFFLPMALQAYDMAGELDSDGLFHRGLLHLIGGDAAAARRDAERILADAPDHVFAHAIAAEAALLENDTARARQHYERLLRNYDTESARQRAEYLDHAAILPQYRERARRFLES